VESVALDVISVVQQSVEVVVIAQLNAAGVDVVKHIKDVSTIDVVATGRDATKCVKKGI
jgi:hypothetical protein